MNYRVHIIGNRLNMTVDFTAIDDHDAARAALQAIFVHKDAYHVDLYRNGDDRILTIYHREER